MTETCRPCCARGTLGGPISLVRDRVVIDSEKRTIDWDVSEEEQARRQVEWEGSGKGTLTVKRGFLLRYARDVVVRGVFFCPSSTARNFLPRMIYAHNPSIIK
jgi:hypothetical protein